MRALAILASDLHFSLVAPVARSAEPDWLLAMKRSFDELTELQSKLCVPIIVAGDYFDKWNASPEIVNFILDYFPDSVGICGQHDLPHHVFSDRHRSAYGTLVRAGKIREIEPGNPLKLDGLALYGFPWGFPITPLKKKYENTIHLAVVHAYIWKDSPGYAGAPEDQSIGHYKQKLEGYDAAVFGDNHKSLISGNLINCGTFFRRKSDERAYSPMLGILYDDVRIEPYFLDVSKDLWLEESLAVEREAQEFDTSGFISSLRDLGKDSLDFRAAVNHRMDQVQTADDVRSLVLGSIP